MNKIYVVYIESGMVKHPFMTFNTESEAYKFCEENNWTWQDENEFVWDLEIYERYENA